MSQLDVKIFESHCANLGKYPGNSEDLLFFSQNVPTNHIFPELDPQKL